MIFNGISAHFTADVMKNAFSSSKIIYSHECVCESDDKSCRWTHKRLLFSHRYAHIIRIMTIIVVIHQDVIHFSLTFPFATTSASTSASDTQKIYNFFSSQLGAYLRGWHDFVINITWKMSIYFYKFNNKNFSRESLFDKSR